jgi:GATA-binding protein, other eukaryote
MAESNTATNGDCMKEISNGPAGHDVEEREEQEGNGETPVKDDSKENDARQGTDSPTSTNGATLAHPGGTPPVCQNCGTSTTPLWRRNELGATLCNACGLFLKLHGRARPQNLKTDTIKSRNRVKSIQQPKKKVFGG